MMLKKKFAGTLVALLIAVLAMPGIAAAQQLGPTDSQYGDTLSQVSRVDDPNDPSTGLDARVGNDPSTGLDARVGPLPFTGFDVIAMAAVALAVTGLGLALQRAVSREHPSQLK
jgi:hypothetical protein